MADGFVELIDSSNAFFGELLQNNTKEWFEPQKPRYTDEIKKPGELLASLLAEDLSRLCGVSFKPKLFRIYRDVRFSKDKTPYNAHLHISCMQGGEGAKPGWFFGSAPDYLFLCTGVMGLQGAGLTRFRALVDQDGDALQSAIDAAVAGAGAEISSWGPEPLKRVPKPYDADHPHAELLKRKNLVLVAAPAGGWREHGLLKGLGETAKALLPVWQVLESGLS
ncbi:MAG: TIGR02453 family protein [Pseudomonadota bacterium]